MAHAMLAVAQIGRGIARNLDLGLAGVGVPGHVGQGFANDGEQIGADLVSSDPSRPATEGCPF